MGDSKTYLLSRRTLLQRSGQALAGASLLGGLGTVLDACGSSPSTASTGNSPITLRFSMLNDPGEIKNAKALGQAFTAQNPHVTFSYEPITGTFDQKLLTEAAGNTLPDVFWSADVYNNEFASKGVALNLDSYLQKDGVNTSDIYPGMLGLGKYNGHQYTLPRDYNHIVTYYNKDAFTKAGLSAPSMNWTYDEFLAACEALVTKGGMKWAVNTSMIWWAVYVPFIRSYGGDMLSADGKSAAFTSANALAGITALTDLVARGYAVNPAQAPSTDTFVSGQTAMTWTVRPAVSSFVSGIGTKFAFDVTRFPKLPNSPLIGVGMSGYSASAQSANPAMAAKFVEFIVSPAGQKIFEATGNSVPVLKSLQSDATWLQLPRPGFNNQAYYYDNANDTLPPAIPVSAQSTYDTALSDAFTSVFLKKASIKDAFAKAADTVNSALQGA